jgi:hypothetical protein
MVSTWSWLMLPSSTASTMVRASLGDNGGSSRRGIAGTMPAPSAAPTSKPFRASASTRGPTKSMPAGGGPRPPRGHHRKLGAEKADLDTVPHWARGMDDDEAFMALVLANSQSELSALERGMHALKSGMGVQEYAKAVERDADQVTRERHAAEVLACTNRPPAELIGYARHLAEIHAAAPWLWPMLVAKLIEAAGPWTRRAGRPVGSRTSPSLRPGRIGMPWPRTSSRARRARTMATGWLDPPPGSLRFETPVASPFERRARGRLCRSRRGHRGAGPSLTAVSAPVGSAPSPAEPGHR